MKPFQDEKNDLYLIEIELSKSKSDYFRSNKLKNNIIIHRSKKNIRIKLRNNYIWLNKKLLSWSKNNNGVFPNMSNPKLSK